MFVQGLFYLAGPILFIWLAWRWVVKPILREKGVDVDGEKITTAQTENLERLKKDHERMVLSSQAAEEGVELTKDIKYMEDKIKSSEERMKEIK